MVIVTPRPSRSARAWTVVSPIVPQKFDIGSSQ
jgi:hypothetical protein